MATTSGTATFNYNRNQICTAALRKIGAIASGETPDAQTIQDCSDQLNIMVKALNATGLHIWTESEAILFLQPGQFQYTLGTGSPDSCADTSFSSTTLGASYGLGASSISVLSTTGFGASFNVGIVLDSGSIYWTTQNGAASGLTINLTGSLPSSATGGNAVYVYQSNIIRPLRVVSGRRFVFSSSIETQMIQMARIDYRNQPNKSSPGTITNWFYDPRGGANTQGQIFLWTAPTDVTTCFKFTYWRPVQDFTTAANIPDLPQEWLDALIWNLALKMAPEYDCSANRYTIIKDQASSSLDNVMGWDREPESYLFGADLMNS